MPNHPSLVRFGVFEVDLRTGEIRKAGIRLKLAGQPFQVLWALLEDPGELVTREQLRKILWPENTFVDHDLALKEAVNRLREVLGDSAECPHFIENIPRRGYRFIGSLTPPAAILNTETVGEGASAADAEGPTAVATSDFRIPWKVAAGLAFVALVALLFGVNLGGIRSRIFAKSRAPRIHAIAVLPLVNLSSDPNQEYFSDGMTDELITELAKFGNLRVISHTSVERYKNSKRALPEIARELGVDAVVEGRVMRSGDKVRITAQLIDARTDQHLWAQSYERDLKDVLTMQAGVAQRIAAQVGVSLSPTEESRIAALHGVDPAAHEAFLKGNFYWNRLTCENFRKALNYYSEAVAKEPSFAPAYAGIGASYFDLADWACSEQGQAFAESKKAAQKAIELDPALSDPYTTLGEIAFTHDWDWEKAEENYREAIRLDGNDADAHAGYAIFLTAMGRRDQAFAEMSTAHELDPTSENNNVASTYLLYLDHQFDRATEHANRALELYPRSGAIYYWLGQIYERKHMEQESGTAYTKEFGENKNEESKELRAAFERSGLAGYWQQQLKRELSRPQGSCWQMLVYAHLGDRERTLASLESGFQHHCDGLQFLAVQPIYDKYRAEPRFEALLRRMNLPTLTFAN